MQAWITNAFYVAAILIATFSAAKVSSLFSASRNRNAIVAWVKSQDLVIDDQKFTGARTHILDVVAEFKRGLMGYQMTLACATPSQRAFLLEVTAERGLVVEWKGDVLPYKDLVEFLSDELGFDVSNHAKPISHFNVDQAT